MCFDIYIWIYVHLYTFNIERYRNAAHVNAQWHRQSIQLLFQQCQSAWLPPAKQQFWVREMHLSTCGLISRHVNQVDENNKGMYRIITWHKRLILNQKHNDLCMSHLLLFISVWWHFLLIFAWVGVYIRKILICTVNERNGTHVLILMPFLLMDEVVEMLTWVNFY